MVRQTHRPFEVVRVDNGSTDGSREVCEDFCRNHAPGQGSEGISFVLTSIDFSNAAAARNHGAKVAKGDWLYFFDSDDEMSPDYLADVSEAIRHNDCDVVGNTTLMLFDDGRTKVRKSYFNSSVSDHILTGMLSTVSFALKKSLLERIGGWNEQLRIWDDWELGIRVLAQHPRIVWLKEKAYHRIYIHAGETITGERFSQHIGRYEAAFKAAHADMALLEGKERQKATAALHAREDILAAHLSREGSPLANYRPHYPALYAYTKYIGKAAWWVFRLLMAK